MVPSNLAKQESKRGERFGLIIIVVLIVVTTIVVLGTD
jgi:hypothetical protein